MIAELECVVLDCPDPHALAAFYRDVLGGTVDRPDPRWETADDWATLHTPDGRVLGFQRVTDHRPPQWGDPGRPQQFHLDLGVPDLDHAQEQVQALGATLLDTTEGWRVLTDPAGHPFCLVKR
ncbi:VOC family protein [Nonomuraea longicatena]|uniref:VOC family protein n=1 Tax=Nonomuraea longicatena TaxID=83682 RepID=A0ABN1Q7M1_9ACTN